MPPRAVEEEIKNRDSEGFEKSAQFKARKSRGVRHTPVRRSDFEMQRNAEIGLFAEPSRLAPYSRPGRGMQNKTRGPRGRPLWAAPGGRRTRFGASLRRRRRTAERRQSDFDLKPAMGYKKQPFYKV